MGREGFGFSRTPPDQSATNGNDGTVSTGNNVTTEPVPRTDDPQDGTNASKSDGRRRPARKARTRPDTIQLLNVRGLANHCEPRYVRRGKIDFLKDILINDNSLFICLTETWFKQVHENAEICPPGYDLIRQDREGRECGGVAVLVRDDLTAEPVLSFSNDGCEILAVKILQLNHICCVVYRPPGTPYTKFKEVLDKLNNMLTKLPSPTPDITIVGDFNFNSKDVSWEEDDNGDLRASIRPWLQRESDEDFQERRQASELIELTDSLNMTQVVSLATREKETLDLIFSNNPDLIHDIDSTPCPQVSDHNLVTAMTSYYYKKELNSSGPQEKELTISDRFKKLNFHEADWDGIQSDLRESLRLNNDWVILSEMDSDVGLLWFYNQLLEICERHVPQKWEQNPIPS